jgi:hypothetical protein
MAGPGAKVNVRVSFRAVKPGGKRPIDNKPTPSYLSE